jgi:type I restriction enzyme S subunit
VANVQRGSLDLSEIKEIEATESEIQALRLEPGDILFNEGGDRDKLGRGWIWSGELPECIHQNHAFRARLRDRANNPKFISYYANSIGQTYFYAEGKQTTNLASINRTKLAALPIPLPRPEVQDAIVGEIEKHFTRLDAGIASLKQAQMKLKAYRTAALNELLPARRSLSSPTAPSGWKWLTLGDACEVTVGFAFKSSEFSSEGVRLLRGDNIQPGALRWNETRYWPVAKIEAFRHLLVAPGDIILAMDRPIVSSGLKIARVRADDAPCLLVQRVARIRPRDGVDASFIYGLMQTDAFIRHLKEGQTGTQLPHVSGKAIENVPIALPPYSEQQRLAVIAERRMNAASLLNTDLSATTRRAALARASVLTAAFTGQLTRSAASPGLMQV